VSVSYGDGAGNTVEENSSICFECTRCRQQGHVGSNILLQQNFLTGGARAAAS